MMIDGGYSPEQNLNNCIPAALRPGWLAVIREESRPQAAADPSKHEAPVSDLPIDATPLAHLDLALEPRDEAFEL